MEIEKMLNEINQKEELLLKNRFDNVRLEQIKDEYLNNPETGELSGYLWHLKEEVKVYYKKSE